MPVTPDPLTPAIANPWARFAAISIDLLLSAPISLAVVYTASRAPAWGLYLFPAAVIAFILYDVYFHTRFGATLGKMALRIRVVRVDYSPLDLNVALKRSFIRAVLRLGQAIVIVQTMRALGPLPLGNISAFVTQVLQENKSYSTLGNVDSIWTLSNIATCILHPQRRALHDFIAGTIVVKNPM